MPGWKIMQVLLSHFSPFIRPILNLRWFVAAKTLIEQFRNQFQDPDGGFYDFLSSDDLIIRPKDYQDNATPCGSSLAAHTFLQMAALTGQIEFRSLAEQMLASIQSIAGRYPTAYGNWLSAFQMAYSGFKDIAVLTPEGKEVEIEPFRKAVWAEFRPNFVFAASVYPPDLASPDLLKDRKPVSGKTTAFFCENFTCKLPVTTPEALMDQLSGEY